MKKVAHTETYYCDICGKEFSKQDKTVNASIHIMKEALDMYGAAVADGSFTYKNVCIECINKVAAVIETIKKEM